MTDKETLVVAILFYKIRGQKYSQSRFCNEEHTEIEISTYNTLCSRGPAKVLAESRKNTRGSHLVFQNEAKNIPRQDFMGL